MRAFCNRGIAPWGVRSACVLVTIVTQGPSQFRIEPTLATRAAPAVSYDSGLGGVIMVGGRSPSLGVLTETWFRQASPWQRQPFPGSPPVYDAGVTDVPILPGVVVFGGVTASGTLSNTTWVFSGNGWSQGGTPVALQPRRRPLLAFDPVHQVVVLHGGEDQNGLFDDTWTWTPQGGWLRVQALPPPASSSRGMAFLPQTQKVTLVVGGTMPFTLLDFDGAQWMQRFVEGTPTQYRLVEGFAVATLPNAAGIGIFGGYQHTVVGQSDTPQLLGSILTWNGASLARQLLVFSNTTGDLRRRDASVTLDTTRNQWIIHGGSTVASTTSPRLSNDTWGWDGTILGIGLDAGPMRTIALPAMCFDQNRGKVILFGGKLDPSGGGTLKPLHEGLTWQGDAWEIELLWLGVPFGTNTADWNQAAAYDRARHRVVVVDYNFRTIEHDGVSWSSGSTATPPTGGRMDYSPPNGAVVYVHGPTGGTFTWNGTTWTQIATNPAMAHVWTEVTLDGGRGQLLAVNPLGTWSFDGAAWQARAPLTTHFATPVTCGITYDESRDRVLLLENDGASPGSSRPYLHEWDGQAWTDRGQLSVTLLTAYPGLVYAPPLGASLLVAGGETWMLSSANPSGFEVIGNGCPGPNGSPSLSRIGTGPWLGETLQLTVGVTAGQTALLGILGFSASDWSGVPLPLDLSFLGMLGCNLRTDLQLLFGMSGTTWSLAVPQDPALAAASFFQQVLVVDAQSPGGAVMSDAIHATIGVR